METTTETFSAFAERYNLSLTAKPADDHTMSVHRKDPFKWECTLSSDKGSMTFPYTMGCGLLEKRANRYSKEWTPSYAPLLTTRIDEYSFADLYRPRKPDMESVLCSFADEASIEDALCFEDWALDLGYDTDSREAERIYRQCQKQTFDLCKVIGRTGLDELRQCEESE